MKKRKRSRPRRRGGPQKLRPTAQPRYPLRARQCQRADRRCENFAVWFEHLGEYFDDVLVSLKYERRAVRAIRALPPWTRHWDATSKVWRIHPGYADQLAATLWCLGYTVHASGDRG
jgi:hypothetical protein